MPVFRSILTIFHSNIIVQIIIVFKLSQVSLSLCTLISKNWEQQKPDEALDSESLGEQIVHKQFLNSHAKCEVDEVKSICVLDQTPVFGS